MVSNIKIYTPIVYAEVIKTYLDDNNRTVYDNEYLFWDGELDAFAEKKATTDYIYFERYKRYVPTSKIQDFGLHQVETVKPEKEEEKFTPRTDVERFNIYLISTRTKISKIVTDSFTKLIYNPDKKNG